MSAMKERKGMTAVNPATVKAWAATKPGMPTMKNFKTEAPNITGSNNRSKERMTGKE